jgi:sterol 3beta-glucosyltransferase
MQITIIANSPAVVPHSAGWPADAHTTGCWFLDDDRGWRPPEALQHFLDAGPPPLYIGFGSTTGRNPERLTCLIVEAVTQSGERAVVGAGGSGLNSGALPGSLFRVGRR